MNHRIVRLIVGAFCVLVFAGLLSQQAGAGSQAKDVTISKDDETTTIDCTGSAINILGDDKNNITVKGACSKLTVGGDDNNIRAETVNEILISGDDNTVSVETVARISVGGDDNKITWKKGVGDKRPEVSNTGDDNNIGQSGNER